MNPLTPTEPVITVAAETLLPIRQHGDFTMILFSNTLDQAEHFVLMKPCQGIPLVRIHSECVTGDIFSSCRCDCGDQLDQSLALIAKEGGALIYLRQEGRGIGLANKLKAYALQEQGYDTVDANVHLGLPIDNRGYVVAYHMLRHLNWMTIRLLTNNPQKMADLAAHGITIQARVPLIVTPTSHNYHYLKTKQDKMGHLLGLTE